MPDLEKVELLIDGARWSRFNALKIELALDSFATIAFEAPFEPERPEFRATFRPFSFKPIKVLLGGEPLFTGTMVGVAPKLSADERTVSVSGYSVPGVLEDATLPASAFPLECNGLTLRQVAEKLVAPFGLRVEVEGDAGTKFRRVRLEPQEHPAAFLAELARQRGMVMSDTPQGALRFLRSAEPGRPVARFREGEAPLAGVSVAFQPQSYYSEITGVAKGRVGARGGSYTVRNTHLAGGFRPLIFQLSDTDGSDVPAAAAAKLGRMFGNAAAYKVEVPTWRDPRGKLWAPNATVTLEAPGAMVYRETEVLIRTVTLSQGEAETTAELGLVLPGSFSGEIPEVLPWA